LCLFCKQFYFDPGCPDWSDITPGEDAEMGCNLYHMHMTLSNENLESYRSKIQTAKTCKDYEQVEVK